MLHFTLCGVFVVIFRNANPTLHGGLSVRSTLQSGNVHMFNGWSGSYNVRFITHLFRGSVNVSTQTRTEVN